MAHDPVMKMIVPIRLYAKTLCRNSSEADQLVKETLNAAIESLRSVPTEELTINLLSVMRNRYFGALSDETVKSFEPEDFLTCVCQSKSNANATVCEHDVEAAMRLLPVHLREALVLVLILDQSNNDAAEVIGCNAATVSKRVNRARNLLELRLF